MATESGTPEDHLAAPEPLPEAEGAGDRDRSLARFFEELTRAPYRFDFFQAMRKLEALHRAGPDQPRFGAASRPADEPMRLGQEPDLAFAPAALARALPGSDGKPARLWVNFFGLLGPDGPLPLHMTEYARERQRNADDPTMARFFDVFHHRMLLFFYRAWASGQPTVGRGLGTPDRFELYIGALAGLGLDAVRSRDAFPDLAKLFYSGILSAQSRNAEGLAAMVGDFFSMPARVEPFVGEWMDLPPEYRWRLGVSGERGRVGISTILGTRTWTRQQKFRLVLGPLDRSQFQRMLPGGKGLPKLAALVRGYVGDELHWDVELLLESRIEEPWRLGRAGLAWTTWLGRPGPGRRENLVLDPQAEATRLAR